MRKQENGTTVLSKNIDIDIFVNCNWVVTRWHMKTQAFSFIKYNVLNFTLYWLVYCCTECIIYLSIKRNKTSSWIFSGQ